MPLPLELPTIQNWSCHSCGGCCRQHAIEVTEAERQRILDQKWTEEQGAPAGMAAFEKIGGGRYRLAHRDDGACVFLDENNRCRIHAKFGEPAKPLACRIYPFAFHPDGGKIAINLRFSCPSVARNLGTPVTQQKRDLSELRDLVVPDGRAFPAPPISATEKLDWSDVQRIVRRFRQMLGDSDDPFALRLVHALFVAGMLGKAKYEKIRGQRVDELLDVLEQAAPAETVQSLDDLESPSKLGKTQFRVVIAQYARKDTLAARGLGYRLSMLRAGWTFTHGKGLTPTMQEALPSVAFEALEGEFHGRTPEIDALFTRYFDVKLQGMGFCGLGCHDLPVVEGFQNLALMYPIVMYLARWVARARGATSLDLCDAQKALTIADHHLGYSPIMAQSNFRHRVRWLAKEDQTARLAGWYSR